MADYPPIHTIRRFLMKAKYKGYSITVTKTKDPKIYNALVMVGVDGNSDPPPDGLFINMECFGRGEYWGFVNANDPNLRLCGDDVRGNGGGPKVN